MMELMGDTQRTRLAGSTQAASVVSGLGDSQSA